MSLALDASTIQAIVTAVAGSLGAFYYRKMDRSNRSINGHAEELAQCREDLDKQEEKLTEHVDELARCLSRQILQGQRITDLEEHNRDLRDRVRQLGGFADPPPNRFGQSA